MERKEALRHVPFLKPLSEEIITAIAAAGQERMLRRGEQLFGEDTPCLGLVVVLRGTVRIYKTDSRGRDLTLATEAPGGSVAELPLFDGEPYPARADAAEEGTTVWVVPPDRFRALMLAHPEIAEHALRTLALRMRRLVQIVEAQTMQTVRARLASYLLNIAEEGTTFRLDDTNEVIASQIGTVRDVVSRTLSGFKEAGLIALQGRGVTVLDMSGLRRVADRSQDG